MTLTFVWLLVLPKLVDLVPDPVPVRLVVAALPPSGTSCTVAKSVTDFA